MICLLRNNACMLAARTRARQARPECLALTNATRECQTFHSGVLAFRGRVWRTGACCCAPCVRCCALRTPIEKNMVCSEPTKSVNVVGAIG